MRRVRRKKLTPAELRAAGANPNLVVRRVRRQSSAGPDRGTIEEMLGYLISLASNEEGGESNAA
jgi:hypothetical protein